jgi:hypothetical protein
MAISNFIPEVWSAAVQTAFAANQVVIPTLSTTYAGEARRGNVVKIVGAVTPSIVDYKAAGRVVSAEALSDTLVELLIDQEKAFSVKVDDIDAVQAAGSFDAWVAAAGAALAEDAESAVLAEMLANGTDISTSEPVDGAGAKAELLAIRTAMAANKVPSSDRYVAVSPEFAALLISGLSDAAAAGGDNELRNGQVIRLYGMTVVETPLLSGVSAVGYHGATVAFVQQIDTVEALRSETSFSDIVRGLSVYGTKVVRPEAVHFVSYDAS